jgi:hypothetical protein
VGKRAIIAALVAYALIGIVTFGHSAAQKPTECAPDDQFCSEGILAGDAAMSAFTAAILWPLYWSWEAFTPTPTIEQEI